VVFALFSLFILQLNNELCDEMPELFKMANPYNYIAGLVHEINLVSGQQGEKEMTILKKRESLAYAIGSSAG